MYTLEIAIAALCAVCSLLRVTAAMSRRNERRHRRSLALRGAYVDDRDSLARFHRIVGR